MARAHHVPAPIGGWNARDSWASMKETDAVLLENWFPTNGSVISRKGYESYATGLGGLVKTLAVYSTGSAQKMLAGANGNIWDVSSGGAASSLASGLSSDVWYWDVLDGTMALCNGADVVKSYAGSTIGNLSLTGPTSANVIGVNVFKSRSYFWEVNSQSFWYSAVNTMGGAVTEFDLGPLGVRGDLMTMTNWTRDGGDGMDDLAVFVFEHGDLVIYQGSNPGDAANWSLVGVFEIAPPVGRRCALKYGGDALLITQDGYVALSDVIRKRSSSFSEKIEAAVRSAANLTGTLPGWEGVVFPAGQFMLFNVPLGSSMSEQHVFNLQTKAWTKFTGWNAFSWARYSDLIYFGGNGAIYKAWSTTSDNGAAILLDAVPAFNYFKNSQLKQVTAMQLSMSTNGTLNLGVITEKDFQISPRPSVNVSTGSSSSPWGSPWGSPWSLPERLYTPLKTTTKVGRALTGRVVADVINHRLSWYSSNYFYETGGFI